MWSSGAACAGRRTAAWRAGICGAPATWRAPRRQADAPEAEPLRGIDADQGRKIDKCGRRSAAGARATARICMTTAGKRFLCIHGHFYQPPRENPWLEAVEIQDSAAPFHDWNERVCAECYAPNGAARILNGKKKIARIVNNYARISYDFGPTLLSWLKENASRTYRMIQEGERQSRRNFGGHSSAMAQVYNHIIMPLANRRDRMTQI